MSNIDDGEVFVKPRVRPIMSELEYERKMAERRLTPDGASLIPDDTPMQPPLGFQRQPSMVDHIRNMIRSENLRLAAEASGHETFEEADDFDIDEDIDPQSPYEMEEVFEPAAPAGVAAEPASPASTPVSVPPGGTQTQAAPSAAPQEPSGSA